MPRRRFLIALVLAVVLAAPSLAQTVLNIVTTQQQLLAATAGPAPSGAAGASVISGQKIFVEVQCPSTCVLVGDAGTLIAQEELQPPAGNQALPGGAYGWQPNASDSLVPGGPQVGTSISALGVNSGTNTLSQGYNFPAFTPNYSGRIYFQASGLACVNPALYLQDAGTSNPTSAFTSALCGDGGFGVSVSIVGAGP